MEQVNNADETLLVSHKMNKPKRRKKGQNTPPPKYTITTKGVSNKTLYALQGICRQSFGEVDSETMGKTIQLMIKEFIDRKNYKKIAYNPHCKIKNQRVSLKLSISIKEYARLKKMAALKDNTSTGFVLNLVRKTIQDDIDEQKETEIINEDTQPEKSTKQVFNYQWLQA